MIKYLMVGIGGFLGAMARLWVNRYVASRLGVLFPYGTFVINMSGCFLIGMIITVLDEHSHWSANWHYLIPVGFIGAYTTFSTFEFETLRSAQEGNFGVALLNVLLSVTVGFAAVWLGFITGRAIA
jgi:CrcB protein